MKNRTLGLFLLGICIFIVSVLGFISLLPSNEVINNDYTILKNADLSFFNILKLELPTVYNRIGPVGALFAYGLTSFFGRFFSLCLLFALFFINLSLIIKNLEFYPLFNKAVIFLFFVFFGNLFLYSLNVLPYSGKLIAFFDLIFKKIMGKTGALIVEISIFIIMLFLLIGLDKIHDLINLLVEKITEVINFLIASMHNINFKSKKKSRKKKKGPKKKKQKNKKTKRIKKKNNDKQGVKITDYTAEVSEKNEIEAAKNDEIEIDLAEKFETYKKPDIAKFLNDPPSKKTHKSDKVKKNIEIISQLLEDKLAEFNIEAAVKNVNIGPIISQYEIEPSPGIKVKKFSSLTNDLALAVKAKSIRVQAPIPGKGLIGIEIPNHNREIIYLKNIILSDTMKKLNSNLGIVLGKDIVGKPVITDLAKMPHLLIAGATGSGKSVCINTLIMSLILLNSPEEVRLIMIDPKRIELSPYEGIPHLAHEIITNPDNALSTFKWAVTEMENRYEKLEKLNVRDIKSYNKKIEKLPDIDESAENKKLPYIVIIVDEYADLLMTAGKEIEMPIARLAQKARAVGIHLILATQRPSTKVITGIIKANFPSRIAFRVSSKIDSRVILDVNGAERLLGKGDMLFLPPGKGFTERIHGAYVSDEEIEKLVAFMKLQPKPESTIKIDNDKLQVSEFEYDDELFPEAAEAIVRAETASVSMLQRQFKIGYARAGRLIDMLEKAGIVGQHQGSKPREVKATMEELEQNGIV